MSKSKVVSFPKAGPPTPGEMEWIGGRFVLPFEVGDAGMERPTLTLWMEQPTGVIVGQNLTSSHEATGVFASTLMGSMQGPMVGPPRSPGRIRVADAALAEEIRTGFAANIPIVVAPTPELDGAVSELVAAMGGAGEPPGFTAGGASPQAVGRFFRAARVLHGVKPWTTMWDDQVLRVDIPHLGVEGACLSILGAGGEQDGLALFPSLEGYFDFLEAVERLSTEPPDGGPRDLGTSFWGITYSWEEETPDSVLDEIDEYGWEVSEPDGYPLVMVSDRRGMPSLPTERDLEILEATSLAMAAFYVRNGGIFTAGGEGFQPVCESHLTADGREVRLAAPYHEPDGLPPGHGIPSAPSSRASGSSAGPKVSRNAPCPCGSGKKYKRCHLARDEAAVEPRPSNLHALDEEVVAKLNRFAGPALGDRWIRFRKDFRDPDHAAALSVPWGVYHFLVEGRTVAQHYLEAGGRHGSARERGWLAAQQASWLSVWEVLGTDPGWSIRLRDLLSGEERDVVEVGASRTLVVRDTLLARVVDFEGETVLAGTHPQPLSPSLGADLVRRARGRLRRRGDVPVDRLRDESLGRYLIKQWERAVQEMQVQNSILPRVHNTDGDPTDEPAIASPEADQFILDFKTRHYATWADEPLPALQGKTPREAVQTREGRKAVDTLIKTMENAEQRLPSEAARYDFSALRTELDLEV